MEIETSSSDYINTLYDQLATGKFPDDTGEIEVLNNLSQFIIEESHLQLTKLKVQFKSNEAISNHLKNLTKSLVRFFVFKNGKNPDVPISKNDIQTHIIRSYNFKFDRNVPVFEYILESARIRLCQFYGFHLKLLMKVIEISN